MERAHLQQWTSRDVARLLSLVEAERRYYQEIIATLPVSLLVVAADLSLVSANRCFRQTFGLRADESPRKKVELLVEAGGLTGLVSDALGSGAPQSAAAVALLAAQGETRFRVTALALRSWDDASEEALLVFESLDESSVTAVAGGPARGKPAKARAMAPDLQDFDAILWERDAPTLAFTFVGARVETLLGYPAEDWLARPGVWLERIHVEDRERVRAFYQAVRAEGSHRQCEYRAITADGRALWLRDAVRVHRAAGASATKLSIVTTDVTERRQLEDQSAQAAAIDALNRLAGRLSHDCNNLLMVVTGYSEELSRRLVGHPALKDDLEEILKATRRLTGLTAQLQAYTRRPPSHLEPCDLNQVIRALEPKLSRFVPAGVRLTVALVPALPSVLADRAQMETAVTNIVVHACAALSSGGALALSTAEIELTEDATPAAGSYASFSARASGAVSGFERQIEPLDAAAQGGDVVPLSVVHAIARQHGGDFTLTAEPGPAAVYRLLLPLAERPAGPPLTVAPAAAEVPTEPQPSLETILVVEDESGIRALMRKILRRQGYNVLEASNADDALRISAEHGGHIHLLLTDIRLPQTSGRRLAEQIRAQRKDIKVMYVSGFSDDPAVDPAQVLQKPFTLGSLLEKVRQTLGS